MIVVDSSALVAIADGEPARPALLSALSQAEGALLAPINYVETGMVLISRGVLPSQELLDAWLSELQVEVAHDALLSAPALRAFLDFGKGRHPARLNLADCFAYALAKTLDAPLLFVGDDFPQTDIRSAL